MSTDSQDIYLGGEGVTMEMLEFFNIQAVLECSSDCPDRGFQCDKRAATAALDCLRVVSDKCGLWVRIDWVGRGGGAQDQFNAHRCKCDGPSQPYTLN